MVSLDELIGLVAQIAQKAVQIRPIPGPTGVQARNSDNSLIKEKLGWEPPDNLELGLYNTYVWICAQLNPRPVDAESSL